MPTTLAWTPVLTAETPGDLAITYSTQTGYAVRLSGDLILCTFNIVTSAFSYGSASGDAQITGLPVTYVAGGGILARFPMTFQGITKANFTTFVPVPTDDSTTITIQASGSAQNTATLAITEIPTGGSVILRGHVLYSFS